MNDSPGGGLCNCCVHVNSNNNNSQEMEGKFQPEGTWTRLTRRWMQASNEGANDYFIIEEK